MYHAGNFLLNVLPTFFFITTFSVLLVFVYVFCWPFQAQAFIAARYRITMYYLVHNLKLSRSIPVLAIGINVVMYVAMLVLFILEYTYFDNPVVRLFSVFVKLLWLWLSTFELKLTISSLGTGDGAES